MSWIKKVEKSLKEKECNLFSLKQKEQTNPKPKGIMIDRGLRLCKMGKEGKERPMKVFVTSSLPVVMVTGSTLIITTNVTQPKNQFWGFTSYFKDKRFMSYMFTNSNLIDTVHGCLTNNGRLAHNYNLTGGIHQFTFQIKNLSDSDNRSAVTLNCESCKSGGGRCLEKLRTFAVRGCMNEINSDVVVSTLKPLSGLHDTGTFQCAEHSGQVFYNNGTLASLTQCDKYAKWEDADKVRCHFSPMVTFVEQILNNGSEFHVSNLCDVSDGFPKETNLTLSVIHRNGTTTPIKNRTTITPKHHGIKASCVATNSFGSDTDYFMLNVSFLPMNIVPKFTCPLAGIEETDRFSVKLLLDFRANPSQGDLMVSGLDAGVIFNNSCEIDGNAVNCTLSFNNITSYDVFTVVYERRMLDNTTLGLWNITQQCLEAVHATTVNSAVPSTSSKPTTFEGNGTSTTTGLGYIIAAAIGGVAVIAIIVVIALIVKRRRKSGKHVASSPNGAIAVSSFSTTQDNPERLEQLNIIYDTADLKSGGNTKEVVDNVLYGTADDVANLNAKSKKKQKHIKEGELQDKLYSTVQKPGNKKKRNAGAEASTSGLQEKATYAVLDKQKKKGKKSAEKQSGEENAGFSGDLQETPTYAVVDRKKKKRENVKVDSTYAVVDKKNTKKTKNVEDATYAVVDKKNKKEAKEKEDATYAVLDKKKKKNPNGKGKSQDGPSTSGATEDCTYAEVKKKDKKPKKDGPDDGDLHGSSKK